MERSPYCSLVISVILRLKRQHKCRYDLSVLTGPVHFSTHHRQECGEKAKAIRGFPRHSTAPQHVNGTFPVCFEVGPQFFLLFAVVAAACLLCMHGESVDVHWPDIAIVPASGFSSREENIARLFARQWKMHPCRAAHGDSAAELTFKSLGCQSRGVLHLSLLAKCWARQENTAFHPHRSRDQHARKSNGGLSCVLKYSGVVHVWSYINTCRLGQSAHAVDVWTVSNCALNSRSPLLSKPDNVEKRVMCREH